MSDTQDRFAGLTRKKKPARADYSTQLATLESSLPPEAMARYRSIPRKHLWTAQKAMLGIASAKGAIKAFCQQCQSYDQLPASVRDCPATACPLWVARPYQPKT